MAETRFWTPLPKKTASAMSRVSVTSEAPTSSRVWSCATLQEGVDHVAAEAAALEKEERELEEQIKALPRLPKFSHGGPSLF